jgi:hypothetical protein
MRPAYIYKDPITNYIDATRYWLQRVGTPTIFPELSEEMNQGLVLLHGIPEIGKWEDFIATNRKSFDRHMELMAEQKGEPTCLEPPAWLKFEDLARELYVHELMGHSFPHPHFPIPEGIDGGSCDPREPTYSPATPDNGPIYIGSGNRESVSVQVETESNHSEEKIWCPTYVMAPYEAPSSQGEHSGHLPPPSPTWPPRESSLLPTQPYLPGPIFPSLPLFDTPPGHIYPGVPIPSDFIGTPFAPYFPEDPYAPFYPGGSFYPHQ